jgi:hypothetical protein
MNAPEANYEGTEVFASCISNSGTTICPAPEASLHLKTRTPPGFRVIKQEVAIKGEIRMEV